MRVCQLLFICDNLAEQNSLKQVLLHDLYRIHIARSIIEANKIAEQIKLDIILIDCIGLKGAKRLEDFKESFCRKNICGKEILPYIVVAPRADKSLIAKAYTEEAFSYVGVPFIRDELLAVIRNATNYADLSSDFKFLLNLCSEYTNFSDSSLLNLDDGMCLLDKNGIIESTNLSCAHLFRYNQEQIVGKSIFDLTNDEYHDLLRDMLALDETTPQSSVEVVSICQDKTNLLVDLSVVEIFGKSNRYMCVINDYRISNLISEKYNQQEAEDELTKLFNRRHFNELMRKEWYIATRTNQSVVLLLLDIDFFKEYNDRYGAAAGDKCLQKVARILDASCANPIDICARFAGEEFVILLPNTDLIAGLKSANNILSIMRQAEILHEDSPVDNCLTLSIGLGVISPSRSVTVEEFINQVSECLYRAKSSGKNCVIH